MDLNYIHPPSWIANSTIYKTLFILRKLFLTQNRFSHYSQFAEDISLARLFDRNYKGFFVDVGCFHPIKYNNTWRLYKRGWRGINIDIDPIKILGFKIVRRKDVNIACAISSEEGNRDYYTNGFYSLTTTLDEKFTRNRKNYVKQSTPCRSLTNVISDTPYKDRKIDLLSIDTEGHDKEVLLSLDIEKYAPRIVAVESHRKLFVDIEQSPLYQLLTLYGYCLVAWCGLTLVFASQEYQKNLTA